MCCKRTGTLTHTKVREAQEACLEASDLRHPPCRDAAELDAPAAAAPVRPSAAEACAHHVRAAPATPVHESDASGVHGELALAQVVLEAVFL